MKKKFRLLYFILGLLPLFLVGLIYLRFLGLNLDLKYGIEMNVEPGIVQDLYTLFNTFGWILVLVLIISLVNVVLLWRILFRKK